MPLPRPLARLLALLAFGPVVVAQTSTLVTRDPSGRLAYRPNDRGDVIPDFSGVGYRNSEAPIPTVPVVRTVTPAAGDNAARLQQVIDEVARLPLGSDGFRGAILFRAGTYEIARPIVIKAGGIVLRGEGRDAGGTEFVATGTTKYDLVHFTGKSDVATDAATRRAIVDSYVPIGATRVTVAPGHRFAAGDWVILHHRPTTAWIDLLDMAQYGWTASSYAYPSERRVVRVEGDTIHLDAPVMDPIDPRYATADLAKIVASGRIENCGIENLRLTSRFASETDENHGWNAVMFSHVKNGWARQLEARYFGYSAVNINTRSNFWITVDDCRMFDPKSQPTGGRRYSFANNGQRSLVKNCVARGGRHDFVSGSHTAGPNVFLNCTATQVVRDCDAGPHHRWTVGGLYDRVVSDMDLNVQNRKSSGSGHGWAGAQILLWNCTVRRAILQNPPGPHLNWAVGTVGQVTNESRYGNQPLGVVESTGAHIQAIPSLFEAQLTDRLRRP
jgi:hypothetical protein